MLFCPRDVKKQKKPMENCLPTNILPCIPSHWLQGKETLDSVGGQKKDLADYKGSKVSSILHSASYYVCFFLFLNLTTAYIQRDKNLVSDIVTKLGIGMRPLDFQTYQCLCYTTLPLY